MSFLAAPPLTHTHTHTTLTSEKSTDRPHSSTHCHSSTGATSTSQHDQDCTSMLDDQEIDNTASILTIATSSVDAHQCHTTSPMVDPEGVEDDIRVLMNHSLPKLSQRAKVITANYTPRGRPCGAFTWRDLGITHASRPDVFNAIHNIARTRPRDFTIDPYMSAQLNEAMSLPVHKEINQFVHDWLIAFCDFTAGRLWLESPIGTHPPPAPQIAWKKPSRQTP